MGTLASAVALLLLIAGTFAVACAEKCESDYGYWVGMAYTLLNEHSFYSNDSSTNCWNRETTPPETPDPCLSMDCGAECAGNTSRAECMAACDDRFQGCCFESIRMDAQLALDQCRAVCRGERQLVETPSGCAGECEFYETMENCTCRMDMDEGETIAVAAVSGTAYMRKNGQNSLDELEPDALFEPADVIVTGDDGTVTLWAQNGSYFYEAKAGPNQLLKRISVMRADWSNGNGTWGPEQATVRAAVGAGADSLFMPMLAAGLPVANAMSVRPSTISMRVRENEPAGKRIPSYTRFSEGYIAVIPETDECEYYLSDGLGEYTEVFVRDGTVTVVGSNASAVRVDAGYRVTASPGAISQAQGGMFDPGACTLGPALALMLLAAWATSRGSGCNTN